MMVVGHYFILLYKRLKINIGIYFRFLMNFIYLLMVFRKVSLKRRFSFFLIGLILVNILELQKQPQEIKRELKNAREELAIAKAAEEQIEGDRFAESIEVDFIFWSSFISDSFAFCTGFYHTC
jgi:hypothetical protein